MDVAESRESLRTRENVGQRSITACLRCRDQKVTSPSPFSTIAPTFAKGNHISSDVVMNVQYALDASGLMRLALIQVRQIVGARGLSVARVARAGQMSAVANKRALGALPLTVSVMCLCHPTFPLLALERPFPVQPREFSIRAPWARMITTISMYSPEATLKRARKIQT